MDILDRFNLSGAKHVASPMSTFLELKLKDGTDFVNPKPYQQLVGSLQYFNLTRPNISYNVNKLF